MKALFLSLLLLTSVSFCQAQVGLSFNLFPASSFLADTTDHGIYELTALITELNAVKLQWKTLGTTSDCYFSIQRSDNNSNYRTIGVLKNQTGSLLSYTDESPAKGKLQYRITCNTGGRQTISETVDVQIVGSTSIRFYPNPVDKILIVRSDEAVEIIIADGFGKPVLTTRLEAGLKLVDMAALTPGIYSISLYQKESNRTIREKLVKK